MCLAAVSGGADSIAMLAALAALIQANPPENTCKNGSLGKAALRCLHVEHGIRPPEESRGDADFVRQYCKSLDIPCRVITVPQGKIAAVAREKGIGIEAAARHYRHKALVREARRLEALEAGKQGRAVKILIAHTLTDKHETTLMRLLRAAGPGGLAAMPQVRGRIVRPLLALGRDDVLQYLRGKNIKWREDASNQDTRFLRNRIRRCLVPVLDREFPGWQGSIDALSHTQGLAADFIREEALRRVPWQPSDGGAYCADAGVFYSQPAIIREEALFQGIDLLLKENPPKSLIPHSSVIKRMAVRRLCAGRQKAADLGPVRAEFGNGQIQLKKSRRPAFEAGFSLLIKEPGLYTLKGVTVDVKPGNIFSGAADAPAGPIGSNHRAASFQAQLPLVLRQCLKGDWIQGSGKKFSAAKEFNARIRKRLIIAVDQRGCQAIIEPGKLPLAARQYDASQNTDLVWCTVIIKVDTGGFNAE